MSEINNYDPNPYDNVTIDEALTQIYDRVNDRTIRQIVTLLKNTAGDTSRYTIEKATAESGEVTYKLMQQINNGTPTPVGDTVGLRGSQILANYDEELQILDNIINVIKVALDGKADTTDIPTVPIIAIQKNGTGITPVDGTVNITVPIVAADVAALPDTTRYAAALSLTIDSATFVVTGQLKDQNGDNLGTAQTIDLPLESVVVGGSYNSQTQKVVLTLQNGNTIEFSVADLVYGLQTELSETNKLNPAYINYDNTHRAVSDAEKSEWNGKQDAIDSSHKLSADFVDDTGATNKFATEEELEQIETNKNNISYYQANGSYNKLRNSATTQTVSNTTFTVQADGTVDISGKPSSGNAQIIISDLSELEDGKQYTFYNGGTVQESTNIYFGLLGASGVPNLIIPPNGVTITLDKTQYLAAIIRVTSSSPITTANFKPMATEGTISHSYEPYAKSNVELTADVASLTAKSQKTISSSGNTSKLRLTLNTSVMSNVNRGSLILSIPFQTSSYDNALLLIAIGNDSFLGVQRLDNSNNSMVTSWALSANNTILDITLRAQPWSAPVAFPLAQVAPPITYSWES